MKNGDTVVFGDRKNFKLTKRKPLGYFFVVYMKAAHKDSAMAPSIFCSCSLHVITQNYSSHKTIHQVQQQMTYVAVLIPNCRNGPPAASHWPPAPHLNISKTVERSLMMTCWIFGSFTQICKHFYLGSDPTPITDNLHMRFCSRKCMGGNPRPEIPGWGVSR